MGWIMNRSMKVQRGRETPLLRKGEPVPEAENWANRDLHEKCGSIRWIPDNQTAKAKTAKAKPAKPVETAPAAAPPAPEQPETTGVNAKEGKPVVELPPKSQLRDMKKADMLNLAWARGLIVPEEATRAHVLETLLELYG